MRAGPNYQETVAPVTIRSGGVAIAKVEPARRRFSTRQMDTTEAGIATINLGQVYVSIGDPAEDGTIPARIYWKPLVTLIWLGAMPDGVRWRSLARRPPPEDRRARARPGRRGAGRCGMRSMKRPLIALGFALVSAMALAVQPDEMLKDPTLEARARDLSSQLRCMVCQNESIDESDASLARDIRLLIRERISKGESNEEVRDFLVSRYGDFILLKPPFKPETLLLWLSAPVTLALGGFGVFLAARRKRTGAVALSASEEARLAELGEAE